MSLVQDTITFKDINAAGLVHIIIEGPLYSSRCSVGAGEIKSIISFLQEQLEKDDNRSSS